MIKIYINFINDKLMRRKINYFNKEWYYKNNIDELKINNNKKLINMQLILINNIKIKVNIDNF